MVLLVLYIIGGLIIAATDIPSFVIYLTILPIQYFLMKISWKYDNLILSLLYSYFFVSMGMGTLMLYLDRESITNIGTNHVGDFDFSYTYLFAVYRYFFVFELIVLCVVKLLNKSQSLSLTIDFVKKETSSLLVKGKTYSLLPLLSCAILFGYISIWMYNNHIGLIGLKQTELPFHLAGILYYARRFVFTVVLIWLFTKTKDKGFAMFILIVYSLVVAVTGSSKSLNLILLVPISFICLMNKRKIMGFAAIISSLLIYTYVTCTREIVYAMDGQVSLFDVIRGSNAIFLTGITTDMSYMTKLLSGVCESLYGMKNVVVAYQYYSLGITDFFSYYIGTHLGIIIPDMQYKLYGVTYAADKAFGICVGFPGTIVMMSCHSFLLLTIESIVMSMVIIIQDKTLNCVLKNEAKRIYKYAILLIFLFSTMMLIEANSLFPVYLCSFIMIIIMRIAQTKTFKKEL